MLTHDATRSSQINCTQEDAADRARSERLERLDKTFERERLQLAHKIEQEREKSQARIYNTMYGDDGDDGESARGRSGVVDDGGRSDAAQGGLPFMRASSPPSFRANSPSYDAFRPTLFSREAKAAEVKVVAAAHGVSSGGGGGGGGGSGLDNMPRGGNASFRVGSPSYDAFRPTMFSREAKRATKEGRRGGHQGGKEGKDGGGGGGGHGWEPWTPDKTANTDNATERGKNVNDHGDGAGGGDPNDGGSNIDDSVSNEKRAERDRVFSAAFREVFSAVDVVGNSSLLGVRELQRALHGGKGSGAITRILVDASVDAADRSIFTLGKLSCMLLPPRTGGAAEAPEFVRVDDFVDMCARTIERAAQQQTPSSKGTPRSVAATRTNGGVSVLPAVSSLARRGANDKADGSTKRVDDEGGRDDGATLGATLSLRQEGPPSLQTPPPTPPSPMSPQLPPVHKEKVQEEDPAEDEEDRSVAPSPIILSASTNQRDPQIDDEKGERGDTDDGESDDGESAGGKDVDSDGSEQRWRDRMEAALGDDEEVGGDDETGEENKTGEDTDKQETGNQDEDMGADDLKGGDLLEGEDATNHETIEATKAAGRPGPEDSTDDTKAATPVLRKFRAAAKIASAAYSMSHPEDTFRLWISRDTQRVCGVDDGDQAMDILEDLGSVSFRID